MQFTPYHLLGDTPNLIVDGGRNKATVLNLSHWPHSGTPKELKDDLSAQIVFRYLDRPDTHVDVQAVSNDHFDEDGLISLYSVLNPTEAQNNRELLIDIANAGDFGKYKMREAARIAFTLGAYADEDRSPLDPAVFGGSYPEHTAAMYQAMLPILPDIIANPQKYRRYWEEEEAFLDASEAAVRSKKVHIEELPDIDLAVIALPEDSPTSGSQPLRDIYHLMATHNATDRFRILLMKGKQYQLYYRYETWIQYISKRPMPRVDLTDLAKELSRQENGNGQWTFTGVEKIDPQLKLTGVRESKILPQAFREQLKSFLAEAPPAWDPYDEWN
jgi:hypothetical protein